ncbi:leucine-rich repeat domain-containing protein [Pseudomonas frederiksbergensis]|uniref:leucine-rich repeat domain-containing protein n=1 Tax=Pseudomonas frederiksbergensis TaxID=104087 RepID=UPI002DBF90A7|nr:leucine-rich repeat domain-containing protein [Pseudomonas frederiksbergensis]WRV69427.1 leucine-rich repeat domain-containing protein [Pseudomonas frederiksbergensis]
MTQLTHHHFIRRQLPKWLLDADQAEQAKLQQAALDLAEAGHRFSQAIDSIPSLRDFSLSRMQLHLDRLFGATVDVERSELIRYFRDDCATYPIPGGGTSTPVCTPRAPEKRSLLEYALINFTSSDTQAQAFFRGSRFKLYPEDASASLVQMHDFAKLCRDLDTGAAYAHELRRQLPQLSHDAASLPTIAATYIKYKKNQLRHDAQQARMQGLLDVTGERILAAFGVQLDVSVVLQPLRTAVASGLELSDRWRAEHRVILPGVRVFWSEPQRAGQLVPIVVHIPDDPVSPIKQYPSSVAFQDDLSERLGDLRYAAFFSRLLPLPHRSWSDPALVELLRKGERNLVKGHGLRGDFWQGLYREWRSVVLSSASSQARSVADIDRDVLIGETWMWLGAGLQFFSGISMFLPGVEPLAWAGVALGMGQFILDVYEGAHALNLGERLEAIQHLFSAAMSAATFGVGAFGANHLLDEMSPVVTIEGHQRLWHGRTEAFASLRSPPAHATVDPYGVWRAADDAWVKIDGRFYEVTGQERDLRLRLAPDYRGVAPALEWRRATGWRWMHRDPLGMQGARLLQEIDPRLQALSKVSLNDAQQLLGISDDRLRYLAVNGEPLPELLPYMARRLSARAQISVAMARLRANQPLQSVPLGVAQLLTELPGWPARRAFRYMDERASFLIAGEGPELHLDGNAFSTGQWQERLLWQFDAREKSALLGPETPWEAPAITHRRLANLLADRLERSGYRLIDNFANLAARHPYAALLRRAFPNLPEPVADALLSGMTVEEQHGLSSGRVPQSLAQRTVEVLRELRVARALEALKAGVSGNDRDRLVMRLFASELIGLAEPVRVQLQLDGNFADPLDAGETGPLKTIRRHDGRYEPLDETGNGLGPPTSLEDALLRALPDSARRRLGLDIWQQDKLRSRLLEHALGHREQLRSALGIRPSRLDNLRSPERVGGHLGYPMSGRGRGSWQRRATLQSRLQALYPDATICAQVMTELQARSEQTGKRLAELISEKEAEWKALDESLETWEQDQDKLHVVEHDDPAVRTALRKRVGRAVRRSWRREIRFPTRQRTVLGLAVESCPIGKLPRLTADFSHVEAVSLKGLGLSEDPSDFLSHFPALLELSLAHNRLPRCPSAIAGMTRLRFLLMNENPLVFDDQVFAPLLAQTPSATLEWIELSGVSSGPEAAQVQRAALAIEALAVLPRLRHLVWKNNLWFGTELLHAIGRLRQLEFLSLSDSRLVLDEQNNAFLGHLDRLVGLDLSGNRLTDLPSLSGLTELAFLDLSQAKLREIPATVIELWQRTPCRALYVILQGNAITQVESMLSVLPRNEADRRLLGVNLYDNPLPVSQIARLRAAKYDFGYSRDLWVANERLRSAFEQLRENPANARFLDWLSNEMARLGGAQDVAINASEPNSRGVRAAERLFNLDGSMAFMRQRVTDLDERFKALQSRIFSRLEPSVRHRTFTLDELEVHLQLFRYFCLDLAQPMLNNFSRFMFQHYRIWAGLQAINEGWSPQVFNAQATEALFVSHLLKDLTEGEPQFETLSWAPYLKEMSPIWRAFESKWDPIIESLSDAYDGGLDTSQWPRELMDSLAHPPQAQPPLEPVGEVPWGATDIELNSDQLRRAWLIIKFVQAAEAVQASTQATEALVHAWWPYRSPI